MATPADLKLCGYLLAVLSTDTIPHRLTPLEITTSKDDAVCFVSPNDAVLYPPKSKPYNAVEYGTNGSGDGNDVVLLSSASKTRSKKRLSRIGMVRGSVSVLDQIHALVVNKCVSVEARAVCGARREEEARVVVLVDVYLPISLWSGWQFPKSKSTAAALFRHLSCDWESRGMLLEFGKPDYEHCDSIWNISDCHVLGCDQHCNSPDTRKKLFELHEIFGSLPSVMNQEDYVSSRLYPADVSMSCGIWAASDDVLINILSSLAPLDLLRVSSTCRHLRFLATSIMPCMKLKLFPHQQAAVEWMLKRERVSGMLPNPLYVNFTTEDGFAFYVSTVSGEVVTGTVPTIRDFRGGMFCDEPGLGKTVTALSLILKTQGTLAEPPEGVEVVWCKHNGDQKCGYYELSGDLVNSGGLSSAKKVVGRAGQKGLLSVEKVSPKLNPKSTTLEIAKSPSIVNSTPLTSVVRCTRSSNRAPRTLLDAYDESSAYTSERKVKKNSRKRGRPPSKASASSLNSKKPKKGNEQIFEYNETWVQCDACRKWRRLLDGTTTITSTAWFCSMNSDPLYQNCSTSEESYDYRHRVTYFPGFHTKGTSGQLEENVSFFTSVLKEHYSLINSETKKALSWLAKLSPDKLAKMETVGLLHPLTDTQVLIDEKEHNFHKIFQAFGLIKRVDQCSTRWFYPRHLVDLVFDLGALRVALCTPLDSCRLYLSRATLVVVPANLVDHWKTQIEKHVRSGQLRVYVWTDHRKPSSHSLAWDYDVVITTFSRLSAEWSPRKRSPLVQVHWLRVMFDEGHTLCSNVNLTNKMQISVSLTATNRWLLTGTPTPNTPSSQLSHLYPMLKFLREEAYGLNQKSWEAGILRPFEAEMEEGRSRLLQLLRRCMISARKADLHMIPPCIKKVTFLNFNEEHAKSYNELVVTVRRNILMADWNDPSHVESLLNPKQWKFRSTLLRNVRLSCCVGGHIKVTDAGQDIQETMDILVGNGLDPQSEEYSLIRFNLLFGGNCMRCQEWCRLPVVTPCRHLLCLDCVALDSEKCTFPGCGNLYEMQSPETLARPENPNPKWPVPKDLIELQPSYKQDDWDSDWQSTSSSKVSYLVLRLRELQEANNAIINSADGGVDRNKIDEVSLPFRKVEPWARFNNESSRLPLEKVIIFSQFLEHIHVIEQQLTIAGIRFARMYSPMHSVNKIKSLAAFQHDAECMALLMDGSAALGLDLSFVTHVFLMEPIWDKSMEEQVISRAHRMGATRPIYVEVLAMHGTIEEQMLKFLQDPDECRRFMREEYGKHAHEGARAQRTLHDFAESNYLAKLSFVRTISESEGTQVTA